LHTALASGRLSLSVVELVARIATPVDEADWVDLVVGRVVGRALTMNVRQLRAELKARKLEVDDDVTPVRVSISITVDRIDASTFEHARLMVVRARTHDPCGLATPSWHDRRGRDRRPGWVERCKGPGPP